METDTIYLQPGSTPDVRVQAGNTTASSSSRTYRFAYFGLLLFSIVYFGRPEDWIPGLALVPVAKIAAGLAIVTFIVEFLKVRKLTVPRELWLLIALYAQLCIAVPFSTWKGGSFDVVVDGFTKIVLITLLLVQAVNSFARLRRLIFVHTAATAAVAGISLFRQTHLGGTNRLMGSLGGIFANPNDLAINICLVLPFGLAFMYLTRNPLKKLIWLCAVGLSISTIVATYSRTGFLSLVTIMAALAWYMGIKARRRSLFLLLMPIMLALFVLLVTGGGYAERIRSLTDVKLDETGAYFARENLLQRSIQVAMHHPFLGVGPGQFAEASGNWHLAHNAFTEFAAEAGVPAMILFAWMLLHILFKVRKLQATTQDPDVKLLAAAWIASLLGLIVSGCFASLEYWFSTYYVVGYGSVLCAIACKNHAPPAMPRRVEADVVELSG